MVARRAGAPASSRASGELRRLARWGAHGTVSSCTRSAVVMRRRSSKKPARAATLDWRLVSRWYPGSEEKVDKVKLLGMLVNSVVLARGDHSDECYRRGAGAFRRVAEACRRKTEAFRKSLADTQRSLERTRELTEGLVAATKVMKSHSAKVLSVLKGKDAALTKKLRQVRGDEPPGGRRLSGVARGKVHRLGKYAPAEAKVAGGLEGEEAKVVSEGCEAEDEDDVEGDTYDYNSTGESYSDEEVTLDLGSLSLEDGDSTVPVHQCKPAVRSFLCSHIGKHFLSASRSPDFDKFFGPHVPVPAPGGKRTRRKGPKARKPKLCSASCANCWARKMWRLRFPWSPPSETAAESAPSSEQNVPSCFPPELAAEDRVFFNQVGGFGSGRELYVSDISAVVHGLAYISMLQCEVSWRDAVLVPCAKDAQFVLLQIAGGVTSVNRDDDVDAPHVCGPSFPKLVSGLLLSVCCLLRDLSCDGGKARWNMSCRSSSVAKEMSDAKEGNDGLARVAFVGSVASALPAAPPNNEDALFMNSSAWQRAGRLEREEEMVLRSITRDVCPSAVDRAKMDTGTWAAGDDLIPSGKRLAKSMLGTAVGTARSGPGMLRIVRRSMCERSQYLELEVGDIPVRTGVASVDTVSDFSMLLSPFSLRLEEVSCELLAEAASLMSATSSLTDSAPSSTDSAPSSTDSAPSAVESIRAKAARKVHERAVDLLSEGIKRTGQQPRQYLKRGKRYLELGMLVEASLDVEQGLKAYTKIVSDRRTTLLGNAFYLLHGEFLRLGAAIAVLRLERASSPQRKLEISEEQLGNLSILRHPRNDDSDDDSEPFSTRTQRFVDYFESSVLEAGRKLDASKSNSAARPASSPSTTTPRIAYEPKSANLPPAPVAVHAPTSLAANERKTQSETEEYALGKECCFDQCDQDTREIRRTEQWAETLCVTGCEAVCHKKCYRTFKATRGNLCASCGKHPIRGSALFMTVETAEELRAKRAPSSDLSAPVRRPSLKGRGSKSEPLDPVESACAAKGSSPSPRASASREPASTKSLSLLSGGGQDHCAVCSKGSNSHAQYLVHMKSKGHMKKVEEASRAKQEAGAVVVVPRISASEALRSRRGYDATIPLSDIPALGQETWRLPNFGISEAVTVLSKAVEDATAQCGPYILHLLDLGQYLDMSAYEVADAEKYFLEMFRGRRFFLEGQRRTFSISPLFSNHPNFEASLGGNELPRENRLFWCSPMAGRSSPALTPEPELVDRPDYPQSLDSTPAWESVDDVESPTPFRFNLSAAEFVMPGG